jgi:hypothetical protein
MPLVQDLVTTSEILAFFGDCSGLHINMNKTMIAPIACSSKNLELVRNIFPAQIVEFPVQYLGLPLSVTRLRKAHLQPLVDRVSATIPIGKARWMNKAGRLTMVKAVLSAKCTHAMIALKIPDWVFKEIDKRR